MASRLDNWCSSESSFRIVEKLKSPLCFVLGADEPPPASSSPSSPPPPPPPPPRSSGGGRAEEANENSRLQPSPRPEPPRNSASPKRPNDPSPSSSPPAVTPNRRDLSSSSPKAADAPATPNDTNASPSANTIPPPVQGGNPFPDTPVAASSEGQHLPGVGGSGGSNPTILIVSMVCAAMFAMLLVGAFVFHRRKQTRAKNAAPVLPSNTHELEDGIFDAVPKSKPGNTEFTIEDFTAAPIGLYDRDANKSPPPLSSIAPAFEINMQAAEDEKRPLSAIPRHMLINTTAPFSPTLPESGRSTPLTARDVIFSSPFSPTDTGYHIAEDQVFGAPMYGARSTTPKTPATIQPTYSPNTAAIAAAVVSAVQGTASAQHSPTSLKNNAEARMSLEWPSVFDDEPYGGDAQMLDLGYGANMAADEDVEEFPDVPRVDPADPRLKVM